MGDHVGHVLCRVRVDIGPPVTVPGQQSPFSLLLGRSILPNFHHPASQKYQHHVLVAKTLIWNRIYIHNICMPTHIHTHIYIMNNVCMPVNCQMRPWTILFIIWNLDDFLGQSLL